ncbi:site-specific integrase [Nonomuraea sp. NPDC023979]|uniref:tyrosine-type recombinase/integrase n=1 Tax=Nonomuraea sp. NPDC023979 TaxID=3154796 RepID=UPI003404F299
MAERKRARNGQGTITPRKLASGSTVYDAWASIKDPQTGKTLRPGKRGHKTEDEAARWIRKTMEAAEAGTRVVAMRGGPTVSEAAEAWTKVTHLKESSWKLYYARYLSTVAPLIGTEPISKVRQTHIDQLLSTLRQTHAPGTLITAIKALTHIWDYAVANGDATGNVIKSSPWPARIAREDKAARIEREQDKEDQDGGLIRVFTPEQIARLFEYERKIGLRHLWQFIASTGVRRGEALALLWSDVDLGKRIIRIRRNVTAVNREIIHLDSPKSNRPRRLYVDDSVIALLQAQQAFLAECRQRHGDAWNEHDLVFPYADARKDASSRPGEWHNPTNISDAFSRRLRMLDMPRITLHGLRHTWASAAYAAGVDLKTIQDHLGHRVDITTLVYVHTDQEAKREAVTRVVDYLGRSA